MLSDNWNNKNFDKLVKEKLSKYFTESELEPFGNLWSSVVYKESPNCTIPDPRTPTPTAESVPPIQRHETFTIEVPGYAPEEIEVTIVYPSFTESANDTSLALYIKNIALIGRKGIKDIEEYLKLPQDADYDNIECQIVHGLLTIKVPLINKPEDRIIGKKLNIKGQ